MTHATFYILNDDQAGTENDFQCHFACHCAAMSYRQGLRVFLLAANKQQAEQIDEYLWQQDPDNFVPHNLIGEGPRGGSPVEIGWPGLRYSGHRAVLINLAEIVANFAVSFAQVVDFVPCDETLKQQARERYKAYRLAGIQITTVNAVIETP
ncbi:DNA polymerase III subunit chi [Photobacterium toruni]|uniref:DNA polymerase III subunit chi n=1 Tax=Photobacterium toruni TaxID=1935446 RepID=A0A1T4TB40_9GAMM|nr:DNA polymerase III subunit chi [Photobacterium toruni]MEC6816405.1 DNA polymerase III subunit chi [Photobacterium toruni]MEC6833060.1 DNA polymerase III subunit chi [Photobacterium toruni]SKA37607.1 DNA polymerase III subunit chi [Photobacterium toruni]